jgi:hypothetical protein
MVYCTNIFLSILRCAKNALWESFVLASKKKSIEFNTLTPNTQTTVKV